MKKDINNRITIIRNKLNMNKNEFAKFLNITPQYLCSIEKGENCLSIEKIILLSQKANVSTDYILLGKQETLNENHLKNIMNIDQNQLDSYFTIIREIINLSQQDENNLYNRAN